MHKCFFVKTWRIWLIIFFALSIQTAALAQEPKTFETNFITIRYSHYTDLSSFLWRISGLKSIAGTDEFTMKTRVDRIVQQVENILGMYPDNFHIDVILNSGYKQGDIALYSTAAKSITVYADVVTDGVLAHEIAHAVINAHFKVPPPQQVQEILCQYVDEHLWQEYK